MRGENTLENLERELDEGIQKLAASYRSVRIPEELKGKVMDTVEREKKRAALAKSADIEREAGPAGADGPAGRGRKDTGGKRIMGKILLRTGQTAAAAFIAVTVLANSGAQIAYAMEQIPIVGAITRVVTFRTYEKQEGNSEARLEVPKVEPESGSGMENAASELNRSVKEYTDRLIAQFEEEVQAGGGQANHALYSSYEVVADSDRLFTLRINVDEIMASGAGSVKIYNIDKKTDKIITLADLFPVGTDYVTLLSDAVKQQMRENMKSDEGKMYFLDGSETDDFQSIKPDQNFYINGAGHLVLVFDEYEAAPGYMGVVEIEVPGGVFQY